MMMDVTSPASAKPFPRGLVLLAFTLGSWCVVVAAAMIAIQIAALASTLWN